jgi:protein PhnA
MATIEKELEKRSGSKCELCESANDLKIYEIAPALKGGVDDCIFICKSCDEQIQNPDRIDPNHWRCLNNSMWSEVPAVQAMAWRMLYHLRSEGWPQDLLDMLYLDDETLKWAKAGVDEETTEDSVKHIDSNGVELLHGDTVVLIKDLNVKGANFTAKRGTAVRNISLVADDAGQIEGRINGQHIVILTQFVKKSN